MKRKVLGIAISMLFSLACSCLAFAAAPTVVAENDASLENEIVQKTKDILCFISPEKELYGLGDVDFSTLYLGEKIPSYRVEDDGLVESEHLYYPIISKNDWVATAIVSVTEAGESVVTVSTVYNESTEDIEAAALLFEDETAYVCSERGISGIVPSHNSTREMSENVESRVEADLGTLEEKHDLQLDNSISLLDIGTQHYLAVPLYTQPSGSTQCWAYCLKSMLEYLGTNATIAEIYEAAGVSTGLAADARRATVVLDEYGHEYTAYMSQSMNWDSLRVEIHDNNSPLFAGCELGVNDNNVVVGHAIVVRGFYVYQNVADKMGIISYMDPLVGRYLASSVDSYDTFIYTSSTDDEDYEIQDFIAAYE